jgi:hypothetical protein
VAQLGTKLHHEQDFYKERLIARGIAVIIPDDADVELVNNVIYDELCLGIISDVPGAVSEDYEKRLKKAQEASFWAVRNWTFNSSKGFGASGLRNGAIQPKKAAMFAMGR